jgi:hypothetical protein
LKKEGNNRRLETNVTAIASHRVRYVPYENMTGESNTETGLGLKGNQATMRENHGGDMSPPPVGAGS